MPFYPLSALDYPDCEGVDRPTRARGNEISEKETDSHPKVGGPMNGPIFIAGVAAAFCTLGHFTVGRKHYLLPMLAASFDDVAKRVNQCVFHYVSVFLVVSAAGLLTIGIGIALPADTVGLAKFIGFHYALFAVVQIVIAATSGIQNAIFKMFQWMIFVFIAVFAWIGAV
jgi:hypothetical protein